jgi:uncharacterized protein (DUF433 family)
MVLQIHRDTVPLRAGDGEMVFVGNTRVPLETVINTFNEGSSPEEIVMQYPALSLANVYQVIGYYLEHRQEIDAYVEQALTHNAQVRRDNEARFGTVGLRERLLARRKSQE